MDDVAMRAGVSRALVSIVFRDLPGASQRTRDRVRATAAEIGYQPNHRARLLSRKQTRLLGVTFGVGSEFHNDLLAKLYAAAARRGYELVLSGVAPGRTEGQAVHDLLSLRCDALILLGPMLARAGLEQIGGQCPTVAVARAVTSTAVDVVRTDDVTGARLATDHLIALGHRRIVHVDGGRAPGAAERRRGYRAAMRGADLSQLIRIVPGGLTDQDGVTAAHDVLAHHDRHRGPSAAFVFNDPSAAGFLDAVRRGGLRVPDDLSVVAYDNSRLASTSWAQLTTVGQDVGALARTAVELAVTRIDGRSPVSPVLVAPSLVVRSTTAAAPALP
jgi:DNA-binding LacI/PurR family transcriptional regulator